MARAKDTSVSETNKVLSAVLLADSFTEVRTSLLHMLLYSMMEHVRGTFVDRCRTARQSTVYSNSAAMERTTFTGYL